MAEEMNPALRVLVILFGAGIAVIGYQPLKKQYGGIGPFLASKGQIFAREAIPRTIHLKRPNGSPAEPQARARLGSFFGGAPTDNQPVGNSPDKLSDSDRGALNSLIDDLNK